MENLKYLVSAIKIGENETKQEKEITVNLSLMLENSKGFKSKEDAIKFSEELKSQGTENLIIDVEELVEKCE